jgi:glycerol-3-phosphate dehydrogenase (NAD(P)+)
MGAGKRSRVAVLGAGSWGTALAMHLARSDVKTVLWGRNAAHVADMKQQRCNRNYLPDQTFPESLELQDSLEASLDGANWVLLCTPSHAFVRMLQLLAPWLNSSQKDMKGLAWACKGLEPGTGQFLHQAAQRELGDAIPLVVVTGPSFAVEVAQNLPTAVTVAGTDPSFCQWVADSLHGGNFRAYSSQDMIGAELGGAVKNVLAVATGISDGMALGNNARAALITRGLVEMMRLGRVLGAHDQTLTGLAGMGDLVLTCTGDLSRNRRLGLALGAGESVTEAVAKIGQVVEGVSTSEEVWRLARSNKVEMPITEQVQGIIHKGWNPREGVKRLLAREQKPEVQPEELHEVQQ